MPREHRGLRLDPVGAGVVGDEDDRIECYKAGDTIIYQINFLMVLAETTETPTIDSSRNEIDFSALPPKGIHDLNPLDSEAFVPKPVRSGGDGFTMLTGDYKVNFNGGDLSQLRLRPRGRHAESSAFALRNQPFGHPAAGF